MFSDAEIKISLNKPPLQSGQQPSIRVNTIDHLMLKLFVNKPSLLPYFDLNCKYSLVFVIKLFNKAKNCCVTKLFNVTSPFIILYIAHKMIK